MVASTFINSTTTWRWLLQVCRACVCTIRERFISTHTCIGHKYVGHMCAMVYSDTISNTIVLHDWFQHIHVYFTNMWDTCVPYSDTISNTIVLHDWPMDSTSCQKQNHKLPETVTAGAFFAYKQKHKLPETVTAVTAVYRIFIPKLYLRYG